MRLKLILTSMLFSLTGFATTPDTREQIEARIKPVGEVRLATKADASPGSASSGQQIYERYCIVCHGSGLAGAPKFRDKEDWKPRMDKKNLDEMLATALKGVNAMPIKGTCMDCSENDLKNAISYMLPTS